MLSLLEEVITIFIVFLSYSIAILFMIYSKDRFTKIFSGIILLIFIMGFNGSHILAQIQCRDAGYSYGFGEENGLRCWDEAGNRYDTVNKRIGLNEFYQTDFQKNNMSDLDFYKEMNWFSRWIYSI